MITITSKNQLQHCISEIERHVINTLNKLLYEFKNVLKPASYFRTRQGKLYSFRYLLKKLSKDYGFDFTARQLRHIVLCDYPFDIDMRVKNFKAKTRSNSIYAYDTDRVYRVFNALYNLQKMI